MRLIDADALKADLQKFFPEECLDGITSRTLFAQILTDISNAPTSEYPCVIKVKTEVDAQRVSDELRRLAKMGVIFPVEDIEVKRLQRPQGEWSNHTVACLLAELFGDMCACNFCGIDEWLPKKCDFANKECPDVGGVACWEQFLKHRKGGAE